MKRFITAILIAMTLMLSAKASLDIAEAPLAMELTTDLESRILKDTERELASCKPHFLTFQSAIVRF